MHVFITGASGYIGSAVARALVTRGHRVSGLARDPAAVARVRATGASPVPGSLTDLAVLARAAASADAVVHTAATTGAERPAVDAAALTAMLDAMRRGVFLSTSAAPCTRSSREPRAWVRPVGRPARGCAGSPDRAVPGGCAAPSAAPRATLALSDPP